MDAATGRPPGWVLDLVLGTVVALGLALIIAAAQSVSGVIEPLAYVFALGFGALMLLRRRWSRAVLWVSVIGVFAHYTLDLPPIGVAVPVLAALFAAADAGRLASAVLAGTVLFLVSFGFRLTDGEPIAQLAGYETVSNVALIAAATALGWGARSRRLADERQQQVARLTADRIEGEAEARRVREQAALSRDLHDGVGHTMSVIAVNAAVAEESLGRDDAAVRAALDRIRSSAARTLGELRAIVRSLRASGDSQPSGLQSFAAVPDLVAAVTTPGLHVELDLRVSDRDVPPQVEVAAYRVIQESLTNVLRHADARCVRVSARVVGSELVVQVTDDGRGSPTGPARRGLAGLSERVRILGGHLDASNGRDGGFAVRATIPAATA